MKGKYKARAANRRAHQAEEAAAAEQVHQAEYLARLDEAEAREAEARAALAQLLPGLLEGMAGQTEIAEIRAELAALRAENKRHWSALRAAFLAFSDDFTNIGDPKYRISDKEDFVRSDFVEAVAAIRNEGDIHAGQELGRDDPTTIIRKHQAKLEKNKG